MKFRALITEISNIKLLAHLFSIIHKYSKLLIIRIMPDKFVLFVSEKNSFSWNPQTGKGGASAWCEIPATFFNEYSMEGTNAEFNEIFLEIASDVISSSLNSLKSSSTVLSLKLKLTKKLHPCLTCEIETQGANSTTICTHDIPILLIPRKYWSDYEKPVPPAFQISIGMPEPKIFRIALDRLKVGGPKLHVKASRNGVFVLSSFTYSVDCEITFRDLKVYSTDDEADVVTAIPGADNDLNKEYSAEVEFKCIHFLLPTESLKASSVICSLAEGQMLHWLVTFGDAQIEYFVPGTPTCPSP